MADKVYKERIKPFLKTIKVTNPTLHFLFFGTQLELWELSNVLDTDESLLYIAPGKYQEIGSDKPTRWLIVVTTRRIILMDKSFIFKNNSKSLYLTKVNGVNSRRGLFFGEVSMDSNSGENDYVISKLWWKDVFRLKKAIEDALESSNPAFNEKQDKSVREQEYNKKIDALMDKFLNGEINKEEMQEQHKAISKEYIDILK